MTLKEKLTDWTDTDVAEYHLAIALGLMTEATSFQTDAKHVFWTNNPVGTMIHAMVELLAKEGILQVHPDDDLCFRWNQDFRGSWEK